MNGFFMRVVGLNDLLIRMPGAKENHPQREKNSVFTQFAVRHQTSVCRTLSTECKPGRYPGPVCLVRYSADGTWIVFIYGVTLKGGVMEWMTGSGDWATAGLFPHDV